MRAVYELWDYQTGNCIGAYDDETAALADVRDAIRRNGDGAAAALVLITAPDEGEGERIAAGDGLIARAKAQFPPTAPREAHRRGVADD